jgi:HIV Tat-specific factor 1
MSKYGGIIKKDPVTREQKIKIYTDEKGEPNGEALVTYFLKESVDQALAFADANSIRPGFVLKVEVANFEHNKSASSNSPKRRRKPKKIYDQRK